ncbi:hypothetical protein CONPUDRAFT_121483 [Coniophora puteana RWD-64-598 SS2]|uniref:Uncharacterized protein n=1 Tax=Coniophora puteana (strain RWD-64-598) TaxID=741705 RepID=A0A5M3MVQ2_CONPW|nr:uncharacterized protein CONPUDRAFT_121483 [Coniophora puteana RWD-64-598 SS2]EIW83097.1 hypothetical protein CONPUDRAFT_121483 [Coniophora puteana RWD-64-598 SS2]
MQRPGDGLPHELVLAIQRILDLNTDAQSDPLDVLSDDFRPVDVINQLFPDDASLGQLEAVQARLAHDAENLQKEVDVLQEELKRDQDPSRMQQIQEMISDLLGQMSRIREKATESEAVVKNITKDIQALDLAKQNLSQSMTTLKRLQMLVNALGLLEELSKERKYKEAAQTLSAIKEISASFRHLTSVHRISQVWKQVQSVQGELRSQLEEDFDDFFLQDPSKPVRPALITDACLAVDVIGPDVRTHIIDRYVAMELKEYRRIFRASDEAGYLDNVSRRYAWFKRLLQHHELEQGRAFPSDWKVGWYLFAKFSVITRDDLVSLLSKAGSRLTVQVLLDTLQQTVEFESSIAKKWATSAEDILKFTATGPSDIPKTMSSAFEPHLGIFIEAQGKALADMLAPHRGRGVQPKPAASLEATPRGSVEEEENTRSPAAVLSSSTELFYFYGQTLDQCAKLSTGQPLLDLCALHKKWLRTYAEDVLAAKMKSSPSTRQIRKSVDSRADVQELNQSCALINTADYCQTTASELEDKIKEKINDDLEEKVSFQTERDLFMSVISSAIGIQLKELESACDSAFNIMSRTSWSSLNQVTGPSQHITGLARNIEQVADVIKPLVEQKKYLRNLFDKACSLVLTKFTNALVKSRPLMEIGAEQLLIDLQVVKTCLTKLPGEALSTSGYIKALAKSTTRLETLLKVIVTPVDPSEGFILNYTLLIGDASFSNFQKILDLKGTPKGEQNDLLDSFLTITSTKSELESTSFLSSLDMDPTTSALSLLGSPSGSRVALPLAASPLPDGTFGSPPGSGPPTGDGRNPEAAQKREVFSDFKRFVTFGLRRDTQPPS